jgi:PH domain
VGARVPCPGIVCGARSLGAMASFDSDGMESEVSPPPIIKDGWLVKQGAVVKNWKKRFFVLEGTTLHYFKRATDAYAFASDDPGAGSSGKASSKSSSRASPSSGSPASLGRVDESVSDIAGARTVRHAAAAGAIEVCGATVSECRSSQVCEMFIVVFVPPPACSPVVRFSNQTAFPFALRLDERFAAVVGISFVLLLIVCLFAMTLCICRSICFGG